MFIEEQDQKSLDVTEGKTCKTKNSYKTSQKA